MKNLLVSTLLLAGLLGIGIGAIAAHGQSSMGDPFTAGLRQVAAGLTSPVALIEPPDGSRRLFIVDQIGLIRVLLPDGQLLAEPFLDVRDRLVTLTPNFDERGLLGLAFHPGYGENGRFFVFYSAPLRDGAPAGWNCTSHVSELLVSSDPNRADPDSERILLQVDKPQFNHNAGTVVFGPDGNLYISLGDGGGANDVGLGHVEDWYADNAGGNGQDITDNLLGSILRIDVDGGAPYAIPTDNPFVGKDGLDEIWAYGFRNPYRISFDGNRLFAGDAGQVLWEEVSLVVKGGNYGWNVKEGTHCFDAENPGVSPAECPSFAPGGVPLRDPIIEYANARNPIGGIGLVVVGGHVYRGGELPQFRGRYVFGDWSRSFSQPDGTLLVASSRKSGLWQIQEIQVHRRPDGRLGHFILGFGRDSRGEVYVLTSDSVGPSGNTGKVYRLVKPGR
ncbi:MAG TPA: PQQ-dependent sugar dehydrogenase [Thermoanaerobaculia bacterium]|nr:PQQ-dependent sugar dehydrogenase [Thermoanaerobaculia bacterium]